MRKTITRFIFPALELAVVCIFFLLLPIFAKTNGVYTVSAYYSGLSLFLFMLYSIWLFLSASFSRKNSHCVIKTKTKKEITLYAALCAVMLAAASGLTQMLSKFAGGVPETIITGTPTPSFWFFVNNVLGAFVFASFEEILYRVFLPARLRQFKVPEWAAYSLSLVLFSMAHRSLGVWGMVNALVCGAALQLCYKKNGSVSTICAVHGSYNLVGRALLFIS
jgi:membrane protease YdiL (CAAX protease family)